MRFSTDHALLIGVGSYIHHLAATNLPTTVEDVRRLAALLTDPRYCGYPAAQVTVYFLSRSQNARWCSAR